MKTYSRDACCVCWLGALLLGGSARFVAAAPGDVDPSFQIRGWTAEHSAPVVYSFGVQHDDRILLGGAAIEVEGHISKGLIRLLPNGTLDVTYTPNLNLHAAAAASSLRVESMVLLPDDRVVFDASGVTDINGTSLRGTKDSAPARLFADGTQDPSFIPGARQANGIPLAAAVRVLAAYPGGEVLVQADGLRRLTAQGAVDSHWFVTNGEPVLPGYFQCGGVQSSGHAIIFGQFVESGGGSQPQARLYRLLPDGSRDLAFPAWQPLAVSGSYGSGQQPVIRRILVLPDDKILLVGTFSWLGQGTQRSQRGSIARLNADGTMDETFQSVMGFTDVYNYPELPQWNATNSRSALAVALAPDGRLVVGGHFNGYDGVPRPHLVRLNSNGTLDTSFRPPAPERWITQVGVQSDGKVLISSSSMVGGAGLAPYWGGAPIVRLEGGPFVPALPQIVQQPLSQSVTVPSPEPVRVQFTVVATSPMPPTYQWLHNGAAMVDGARATGTRTSTLGLVDVDQSAAGRYECIVSNPGGRVTSAAALLWVNQSASPVPDFANPLLKIASPETASIRTSSAQITFRGLASDNVGLAEVLVRQGAGPAQPVWGREQWSHTAELMPGTNHFRFQAVDLAGNVSMTSTRVVTFVLMKGFSLTIHGSGNVSRPTFGASLEAERAYTLQATPKPGNLFSNWVVNGQSYSDATFRFVLTNDLNIAANFVPDPFPALAGTYHGLFTDSSKPEHANSGSVHFKVTSSGGLSGKGMAAGQPFVFSGRLSLALQTRNEWTLADGRRGAVHLQLTEGSDTIAGAVNWSGQLSPLTGYQARPASNGTAPDASAKFTAVMTRTGQNESDEAPPGHSYATLRVNRNGQLRLNGWLENGSAWTASGPASAQGQFPLYLPLAHGQGSLFGWLTLAPTATNDVHGYLLWTQPGAFINTVVVMGSKHQPPARGEFWLDSPQAILIRAGGNLANPITNSVALSDRPQVLIEGNNPDDVVLNLKPASGLLVGRFIDPAGRSTPLKGVVLGKQGVGIGSFPGGTNQAGTVFLGPLERYGRVR